ncbi:MAG: hypothetical protein LBG93_01680 [Treponema sp.]|jgi:hypothetical protein|nr:hypothetical protein [Treponema sp.]
MQIVLIILSAGLLGLIIYFAVSSSSSRLLKRVSIVAMGLIALSLVVAGIIVLLGPGGTEEVVLPIALGQQAPAADDTNYFGFIMFLLLFLLIIGLIIALTHRDSKKKEMERKNALKTRSSSDGKYKSKL